MVSQRRQPALPVHAEPDGLPGCAPVADGTEHLLAAVDKLYRALKHFRRQDGQDLRPGYDRLGAEAAADEGRTDQHVFRRNVEPPCKAGRRHHRGLVGQVQRQPVAVPFRHDGMGLHGVVILTRCLVGFLHPVGRRSKSCLHITFRRAWRHADADAFRHEWLQIEPGQNRFGLIGRSQQHRALRCRLKRFGNDQRDRLAGIADGVRPEAPRRGRRTRPACRPGSGQAAACWRG